MFLLNFRNIDILNVRHSSQNNFENYPKTLLTEIFGTNYNENNISIYISISGSKVKQPYSYGLLHYSRLFSMRSQ